jgi:hypothetical protein
VLLLLLTSRLIQPDFTIGAAADDSTAAASTTAGAVALGGETVACPQQKHGRVIQLAVIAGPSLSR